VWSKTPLGFKGPFPLKPRKSPLKPLGGPLKGGPEPEENWKTFFWDAHILAANPFGSKK